MNITINNDKIIIQGHFKNKILCAKMDLLCSIFNATVLHRGYAEVPFSTDFLFQLYKLNTSMNFSCDTGGCSGEDCAAGWSGCSGCQGPCENCSDSGCGFSCSGRCDSTCSAPCANNCSGDCDTGCRGCGSGCSAPCAGNCSGDCDTGCNNTCLNGCTLTCKTGCDDGCSGNAVTPVYTRVKDLYKKLQLGEIIYANEFTDIETLIRNEATRREKTPYSKESEKIGEIISVNSPNLLVKDLNNMSKTFSSLIAGDITLAETTKKYIQAGIELYETVLNPGP